MTLVNLLHQSVVINLTVKKQFAGTVLQVGEDFLLLDDDTVGTIIIPLEHVKKITANTYLKPPRKPPVSFRSQASAMQQIKAHTVLPHMLQQMNGAVLQIEGCEAEPTVGYLIEAKTDYLVICVIPDGLLYYPTKHIFALSILDVSVQPEFATWVEQHVKQRLDAPTFLEVLQNETGQLVKLGRGSPEEVSGILRNADAEFVEIVTAPHESVMIPTHHVKTVARDLRFDWSPEETPPDA